jgi:tripartite-type tricarboxylate transporter receptor subunit TctC
VSQLAAWITTALQSPVLKAKLAPLSLYPVGTCGAEFAASLHKQYEDFGRVIRESNMKAE